MNELCEKYLSRENLTVLVVLTVSLDRSDNASISQNLWYADCVPRGIHDQKARSWQTLSS